MIYYLEEKIVHNYYTYTPEWNTRSEGTVHKLCHFECGGSLRLIWPFQFAIANCHYGFV